MSADTQAPAGYFVWQVPGKPVAVHIHLDVIDRLSADVQGAFAAVPKRGAEAGGILLGVIEPSDPTIVRIEDSEPVETEYKSGPSYLLTPEERAHFRAACDHFQPDPSRPFYAVGYYRSHTRDGLSLAPEDIELLDEFFPAPAHIALLIKPYANKVPLAGFFFREDGLFPQTSPQEFPFRRRELAGVEEPPTSREPQYQPRYEVPRPAPPSARSGLRSAVWIPLSFVFLLFGVALGLMIALTRGAPSPQAPEFSLGLAVSRSDDNLNVHWNRDAPAIHQASRGILEIEDGSYSKSVDLDPAQLKNGSIIYRNSSNEVRFRLIVYPAAHLSITESADWTR